MPLNREDILAFVNDSVIFYDTLITAPVTEALQASTLPPFLHHYLTAHLHAPATGLTALSHYVRYREQRLDRLQVRTAAATIADTLIHTNPYALAASAVSPAGVKVRDDVLKLAAEVAANNPERAEHLREIATMASAYAVPGEAIAGLIDLLSDMATKLNQDNLRALKNELTDFITTAINHAERTVDKVLEWFPNFNEQAELEGSNLPINQLFIHLECAVHDYRQLNTGILLDHELAISTLLDNIVVSEEVCQFLPQISAQASLSHSVDESIDVEQLLRSIASGEVTSTVDEVTNLRMQQLLSRVQIASADDGLPSIDNIVTTTQELTQLSTAILSLSGRHHRAQQLVQASQACVSIARGVAGIYRAAKGINDFSHFAAAGPLGIGSAILSGVASLVGLCSHKKQQDHIGPMLHAIMQQLQDMMSYIDVRFDQVTQQLTEMDQRIMSQFRQLHQQNRLLADMGFHVFDLCHQQQALQANMTMDQLREHTRTQQLLLSQQQSAEWDFFLDTLDQVASDDNQEQFNNNLKKLMSGFEHSVRQTITGVDVTMAQDPFDVVSHLQ